MTKKVIAYKNMPTQFPTGQTIAVGLLLDRLHAPGWVWGALGLFYLAIWIGGIVGVMQSKFVDIFEEQGQR